jgi:phosphatidylinositol alpha-1,6-mannosyltransferase
METYSVELAAGLSEHFDVQLLVLPGRNNGDTPGLLGYSWFVIQAMAFCLLRGRQFPNVIFGDLVLFPAAICHWLVAARQRRLVVVYGLDLVYQSRPGLLPALYGLFFAAFSRCQGIFREIVAISRHTADIAVRAGLRNVTVINPSLPVSELTRGDAIVSVDLPAAWQRATQRILYFGRLVPRKGALWFARSVLPSVDGPAEFFVVGQSSDNEYRGQLERCPRTHCLGRVGSAQLAALIRSANVVVMPNVASPRNADVEGFGLAAIEACALGGRLLAASIDGITDAVIDGETGTLLPPGDVARWIQATSAALVEHPRADRERIAAATRACFSRANQSAAFVQLLVRSKEV